jgi:orotidine-5'-phosphate decarboxylase
MTFYAKLDSAVRKNNSLLCVGLDTIVRDQFAFNKKIIEATHDLVSAYKINSTFYEARGARGMDALEATCALIHRKYPEIVLILDVKKGDVGNTNEAYVPYVFDELGCDAITLNPYVGGEALRSFLDRKDRGCIILCRSSYPGSGELQDLAVGGKPLYQVIAQKVANSWNANRNCALVVGATYPTELAIVRRIVGDMPLLVPGVGAQGGDLARMMQVGLDSRKSGLIVNSSRGILLAKDPRREAQKMKDEINTYRK